MSQPTPKPVDWAAIGRRISDAQVHFTHHAEEQLYGDDYYVAVAKRALGQTEHHGREGVSGNLGLISVADHEWTVGTHQVVDRMAKERAEAQVAELRAEVRRIRRDAWRDAVRYLREWCNERRIPARLRREGFLLAADVIDPDIRRDRFGDPVKRDTPTAEVGAA
jgi:hypothetical protein